MSETKTCEVPSTERLNAALELALTRSSEVIRAQQAEIARLTSRVTRAEDTARRQVAIAVRDREAIHAAQQQVWAERERVEELEAALRKVLSKVSDYRSYLELTQALEGAHSNGRNEGNRDTQGTAATGSDTGPRDRGAAEGSHPVSACAPALCGTCALD